MNINVAKQENSKAVINLHSAVPFFSHT